MTGSRTAFLVTAALLASCRTPEPDADTGVRWELDRGPRVLCVVAHPDDEIAFSGTLYKTATHLGGRCDILVVTNGEGGFKYSTLGERVYKIPLTDPKIGREQLPAIRKRELRAACDVLEVDKLIFLDQTDHRFTRDPNEVLAPDAGVWDVPFVRGEIVRALRAGDYDFVLTHLPSPRTHGHHQAATILALEAIRELPQADRPIALGAFPTGRSSDRPEPEDVLPGFPITRLSRATGPYRFDRNQPFGFNGRLSYQIVINWAIAAHKSQGSFQLAMNRWEWETFYPYALTTPGSDDPVARWFGSLTEPQFAALDYDEHGNLKR